MKIMVDNEGYNQPTVEEGIGYNQRRIIQFSWLAITLLIGYKQEDKK